MERRIMRVSVVTRRSMAVRVLGPWVLGPWVLGLGLVLGDDVGLGDGDGRGPGERVGVALGDMEGDPHAWAFAPKPDGA